MHEEMLTILNTDGELKTLVNQLCICLLVCIDNNTAKEQSSTDTCYMYKQGLLLSFSMDKVLV